MLEQEPFDTAFGLLKTPIYKLIPSPLSFRKGESVPLLLPRDPIPSTHSDTKSHSLQVFFISLSLEQFELGAFPRAGEELRGNGIL